MNGDDQKQMTQTRTQASNTNGAMKDGKRKDEGSLR